LGREEYLLKEPKKRRRKRRGRKNPKLLLEACLLKELHLHTKRKEKEKRGMQSNTCRFTEQ